MEGCRRQVGRPHTSHRINIRQRPRVVNVLLAAATFWAPAPAACLSVCSLLSDDSTRSFPKGWRKGFRKLHSMLGCDQSPSDGGRRIIEGEEGYLKGLLHPVSFFRVELSKEEGEKLGCGVSPLRDFLEVDKVGKEGAVVRWNKVNPSKTIRPQDRIIRVNGIEGNTTLMSGELRDVQNSSLRIVRIDKRDREIMDQKRAESDVKKIIKVLAPLGMGPGIPEPPGSQVVTLHVQNIDKVIAAQPYMLLMIYASWCGHCKELAPKFTEAASLIKEADLPVSVRLAKFDDGDEINRRYAAGDKFNFTSYPSFRWFDNGKHEFFGGADDAETIHAHVTAKVKGLDPDMMIKKALLKSRPMLYRPDTDPGKVLDLEPETFDDTVLKEYEGNNRVWIIEYYSDKCPFCKSLKPEIIKASEEVKKSLGHKVSFAGVNSRAFSELAERFGVTSYPWIISLYAGKKIEDMAGLGGAESVINWAKEMHKKAWKKKPKWSTEKIAAPKTSEEKDDGNATSPELIGGGNESAGTWREVLGRRTWFYLHTVAAKYPEEPTKADEAGIRSLVASLGQHYPCPLCRIHLRGKLLDPDLGPVATSSRTALAVWFCNLHNTVNKDLGKSMYSCNPFELDLKYLKSCGECSVSKSVDGEEPEAAADSKWDFFRYLNGDEAEHKAVPNQKAKDDEL